MKGNRLKKLVYQDCMKAMLPALLFGAAGDIIEELLAIYIATVLGNFTDAIFCLDANIGKSKIGELIVCVSATLVIVPILGTVRELMHFSNSLKHDRFVYGRYLDKTYLSGVHFAEGEVQYRLEQDPIDLRCRWLEIARKCTVLILALPYLVYRSGKISILYTVLTAAVSTVKLVVPGVIRRLEAKYDKQESTYRTQMRIYETEFTRKPYDAKLYGVIGALVEQIDRSFHDYCKGVLYKSVRYSAIVNNILIFLDTFCFLLLLFAGTIMTSQGMITPGSMVAMMAFFPIWNTLVGYIGFMIRKMPMLDNIAERVTLLYGGGEDCSGKEIGTVTHIKAEELSFSYKDTAVFQKVDFDICQGDKVAVCGKNGSGKSTLVKILCGLLDQYEGSITLNGEEVYDIAVDSWRKQVAFVEQDPYLFAGTIRQNILLGNLKTDRGRVDEVMEELGIGYLADREVSTVQKELSGGEKQRVSLARALLRNASVLIFDEPSNHIDQKAEEWLCTFIRKAPETVIFVSHDKYLLKIADKRIQL